AWHQHVTGARRKVRRVAFLCQLQLVLCLHDGRGTCRKHGAALESQLFKLADGRKLSWQRVLPRNLNWQFRIAPQQGVERCPAKLTVLLQHHQMFNQLAERDLRLQDILLRNLAHRVLDSRRFQALSRDYDLLVMNLEFISVAQQIVESFPDSGGDLASLAFKFSLSDSYSIVRDLRPQSPFARPGQV